MLLGYAGIAAVGYGAADINYSSYCLLFEKFLTAVFENMLALDVVSLVRVISLAGLDNFTLFSRS